MEFYQLKIIRKGTKPPVWRRCLVPSGITFAQMAVILEELLEYSFTDRYEFEFYQEKVHVREQREKEKAVTSHQYDFVNAPDTFVNDLLDRMTWFTFRMKTKDRELPEYRAEVEKKIPSGDENGKITELCPCIIKEKTGVEESFWGDMEEKNIFLKERFRLEAGEEDYRSSGEIKADFSKGKTVLVFSEKAESKEENNQKCADSILKDMTETIKKALFKEMKKTAESRSPKVVEYLQAYEEGDLIALSEELGIPAADLKKEDLAAHIAEEILKPEFMKKELLRVDEWEFQAFEDAMKKHLFHVEDKDWEYLEWASDIGYVASYEDDFAEVPREVISVYKKICTPQFRTLQSMHSWLNTCITMFEYLYMEAPARVLYRMYRRRKECRVSYEEFLELFSSIPEEENTCVLKGDKVVMKELLEDEEVYRMFLAQRRNEDDFYIPSEEEIMDCVKNGYPSHSPVYSRMREFLTGELGMDEGSAEGYLCIIYRVYYTGGLMSEAMDVLNKNSVVFQTENQARVFAELLMEAYNRTRKTDLCGHMPETPARNFGSFSQPGAPFMASEEKNKKIYPNDPCPCGSGKKYKKCCGRN